MNTEKLLQIPDFMILLRAVNKYSYADISMKEYSLLLQMAQTYLVGVKDVLLSKGWIKIEDGPCKKKFMRITESGKEIAELIDVMLVKMCITDDMIFSYKNNDRRKKEVIDDENKGEVC